MGWVLAAMGVFAVCGAVFDWDWFMGHRKAQRFAQLLGRKGTRILYGVIGTGVAVVGVLIALGVIQSSK